MSVMCLITDKGVGGYTLMNTQVDKRTQNTGNISGIVCRR